LILEQFLISADAILVNSLGTIFKLCEPPQLKQIVNLVPPELLAA
jgi:hypothetical protein